MTRVVYHTAATLNGFLADEENSLDWLFAVEGPEPGWFERFLDGVGVLVMGSTTYRWVLDHEQLLDAPQKWAAYYGERPTYVFTTRDLPAPAGADIRFVSGPPGPLHAGIATAAGERDVWVVGGGDLAGQFLDAGRLDEVQVSLAPATLTAGAPLLPRRVDSRRLRLREVRQMGQFAHLVYDVTPPRP